jgi:hypothetical protein
MERITFYVDPAWRRPHLQHIPLLYPFWGNPLTESVPFWRELFNKRGFDTRFYSLTDDPARADMVLMPYSHTVVLGSAPDMLEVCATKARAMGKRLLIDGLGDVERQVSVPGAIVLRYGGYRFEPRQNVIQIPPYADDLLEIYRGGRLQVRHKGVKPVIGFAGWASLPLVQELRTLVKELPVRLRSIANTRYRACRKGVFFRREAISVLRSSDAVEANFIARPTFSASVHTMSGAPADLRREFVENLLSSDYGLCIRGDANASVRLFETMALGRIPVILDTELVLPFADKVDYRSFALIVDFRELKRLPELLARFHSSLSDGEFTAMQERAREAYVRYFRVDALMPHILDELAAQLAEGA